MPKDPIVEEIHAIRAQIARECHDDLRQVFARLRAGERTHRDRLVRPNALRKPRQALP